MGPGAVWFGVYCNCIHSAGVGGAGIDIDINDANYWLLAKGSTTCCGGRLLNSNRQGGSGPGGKDDIARANTG